MEKKKWVKPTISGPFSIEDNPKVEAMFRSETAQHGSLNENKAALTSEGHTPNGSANKILRRVKGGLSDVAVKVN